MLLVLKWIHLVIKRDEKKNERGGLRGWPCLAVVTVFGYIVVRPRLWQRRELSQQTTCVHWQTALSSIYTHKLRPTSSGHHPHKWRPSGDLSISVEVLPFLAGPSKEWRPHSYTVSNKTKQKKKRKRLAYKTDSRTHTPAVSQSFKQTCIHVCT